MFNRRPHEGERKANEIPGPIQGRGPGTDRAQADGCQPASAHSSPLTAEFETRKQIASAISSGLISRRSWVYGRTFLMMYSSPSARTIGVSVKPGWMTQQRTPW